jgi:hypothetical protein
LSLDIEVTWVNISFPNFNSASWRSCILWVEGSCWSSSTCSQILSFCQSTIQNSWDICCIWSLISYCNSRWRGQDSRVVSNVVGSPIWFDFNGIRTWSKSLDNTSTQIIVPLSHRLYQWVPIVELVSKTLIDRETIQLIHSDWVWFNSESNILLNWNCEWNESLYRVQIICVWDWLFDLVINVWWDCKFLVPIDEVSITNEEISIISIVYKSNLIGPTRVSSPKWISIIESAIVPSISSPRISYLIELVSNSSIRVMKSECIE